MFQKRDRGWHVFGRRIEEKLPLTLRTTGVPWSREREVWTPITVGKKREAEGQKESAAMKESVVKEYLSTLESRHRNLDEAVSRLDRRAYLTPTEQQTVAQLKKEKLMTKDRIVKLRSSYPPPAK
jgi:hypothetical protein